MSKRSFSGRYSKGNTTEVRTEPQPVKGQKAPIEKQRGAAYHVWKWSRNDDNDRRYFVFTVVKVVPIRREGNDREESQDHPILIQPERGHAAQLDPQLPLQE